MTSLDFPRLSTFLRPCSYNMSVIPVLLVCTVAIAGKSWAASGPPQNLTALNNDIAPAWVDDPNTRGTWSILYSCVFTLVLCVWRAIHLNIPGHGETQMQQFLRKIKGCLLLSLPQSSVLLQRGSNGGGRGSFAQISRRSCASKTRHERVSLDRRRLQRALTRPCQLPNPTKKI